MTASHDKKFMLEAIKQAEKGWGMTTPNPMVGAVVTVNNEIVGRGYHKKAGQAHAEVNAIRDAENHTEGATIYVTLEPCCTQGRTPPCTQAIINAGIKRVVIGCLDPNPNHAGKAIAILEKEGIEVIHDIEIEKCRTLNEHFFHWITTGRPYVILKMAMTLDGKIATKSGQSQWITGPESRSFVQKLRRLSDAIMVGGETVRLDNPSLTVREPENWPCQPKKIILSRKANFPADMKIFQGQKPVFVKMEGNFWQTFLDEMGKSGVTCLLIEGGGETAAHALEAGVVNKVHFMIAPKILMGNDSCPVIGGTSPETLNDALPLTATSTQCFGNDIMISGYLEAKQNPGL